MKPLDPRLLRYARAARFYVVLTVILGIVLAGLIVVEALLIAHATGPVVDGTATISDVLPLIAWLAIVIAARAAVAGIQERYAQRSAARTISQLRKEVLEHSVRLGPRWLAEGHGPRVVSLATQGLDDLGPYFVKYLPQLLLAVTVTPATMIVVLSLDWVSAVLITITIPLVPIFMILIGKMTKTFADRRLATMQQLGSQILDLLAGLPTLRALGRERGPAERVRALGDAHRKATMGTLRVAFLSGMVLELLTTLSVAMVAVGIGLRLVAGDIDLTTGLAVLILTPEVFWPLRNVGTHFHASSNGVAAADQAFEILQTPVPATGEKPAPDLAHATIRFDNMSVAAPGRLVDAPFDLSAEIAPRTVVALTGSNGAGKSTTIMALLGLTTPSAGRILVADGANVSDIGELDPTTWWPQIAWVPQRPAIVPGSVLTNLLPGGAFDDAEPELTDALQRAAAVTGFDRVVADLPDGWHTIIGHGGFGLSVGQRQRLALTRALAGDEPLVILDEPTAHLDSGGERPILAAIHAMKDTGRTVLLVAHRPSLLAVADSVIEVNSRVRPADDHADDRLADETIIEGTVLA